MFTSRSLSRFLLDFTSFVFCLFCEKIRELIQSWGFKALSFLLALFPRFFSKENECRTVSYKGQKLFKFPAMAYCIAFDYEFTIHKYMCISISWYGILKLLIWMLKAVPLYRLQNRPQDSKPCILRGKINPHALPLMTKLWLYHGLFLS